MHFRPTPSLGCHWHYEFTKLGPSQRASIRQRRQYAHSSSTKHDHTALQSWQPELFSSDLQTHRKSGFQAHATRLSLPGSSETVSVQDKLETLFAHIPRLHPRTKRATHRMWAYRCRHTLASYSDVEPAFGSILERLLELNYHSDVVVVVYRWYGGVKIGGERWRCISGVASEALRMLGAKQGKSQIHRQ
ncbi:hypothetical protein BC835DRAFT_1283116 [Cytidiella melzeri]|nr:hypothetical protein BC835DRAFT_1283116 [Cytidiella melzeri]